jgi:hypothetical protein
LPRGLDHDIAQLGRVHDRNAQAAAGIVQTFCVHVRAENTHLAIHPTKRLVTVEHGLTVVQHRNPGLQRDRLVRLDFGVYPFTVLVTHTEHMVGENGAESELVEIDPGQAALLDGGNRKIG